MIPDATPEFDATSFLQPNKTPKWAGEVPRFEKWLRTAQDLQDVVRHRSSHAAGVVVGDRALRDLVPLCKDKEGMLTQFDMKAVEKVGLLKIDILGLETLTVIRRATNDIITSGGPDLTDMSIVPLDDPETFVSFREGRTVGVFQLESFGMRHILTQLAPEEIEHIIATVALYRPGPLDAGMVQEFIDRKKGKHPVTYLHPCAEELLKPTYGVLVYQEQIMQLAVQLCGYSLSQADELRRVIGKKLMDLMPVEKQKFVAAAKAKHQVQDEQLEEIWRQVETFGRYGFNKPHAASYATIAYWTMYLKTHYPHEFMASLLTSAMGDKEKFQRYVFEAVQRMKIPVFPPDINRSDLRCTVERDASGRPVGIRAGFMAIDGIAMSTARTLVEHRPEGGYEGIGALIDCNSKVKKGRLTKKAIQHLVLAGACDDVIVNRKSAVEAIPDMMKAKKVEVTSLFEEKHAEYATLPEYPAETLRQKCEEVLLMPVMFIGESNV
jgi:DNA polymerase-3 subunit alpha